LPPQLAASIPISMTKKTVIAALALVIGRSAQRRQGQHKPLKLSRHRQCHPRGDEREEGSGLWHSTCGAVSRMERRCPFLAAKRKTYARLELFSFWTPNGLGCAADHPLLSRLRLICRNDALGADMTQR